MNSRNETSTGGEACWNRTGVWGSAQERCPRLAEITHCRNCQVFTDAGRNLLDREPPPGYLEEWAKFLAGAKKADEKGTMSIIVFRIGRELMALRSNIFKEVVSPRPVHKIPHRSDTVMLGLVNIHGELRLCFSLKALLGGEADVRHSEPETAAKMLVVQKDGESWVFPADQVLGVFRCDDGGDPNVPVTVSKASGTYTRKVLLIEGKEVGLLDDELLLYSLQRRLD